MGKMNSDEIFNKLLRSEYGIDESIEPMGASDIKRVQTHLPALLHRSLLGSHYKDWECNNEKETEGVDWLPLQER